VANLARFHGLGLKVLTVSASREQLRDNLAGIMGQAKALQSPRVSVWWGPCETRDSLLRDAELYNSAGAALAAEGIKLCYHNHDHEFHTAVSGVCALDVLAEHTDPKAVWFEIDIAWVTFGGEDPVKVLRRMAGRVPAIHVKDLWGLDERGRFTAVGTGVVKIREAVQAAIETGVEWIVVEQDKLRNLTAFETITVSYLNLKEAGLV
jgi:sugar phosphate isomerase/epimerase